MSELSPSLRFSEPCFNVLNAAYQANTHDDPNYYAEDPRSLASTSTVRSFMTGTGDAIYRSLAPLLESANQELILVTCFWARSASLDTLSQVLRKLSDKAIRRGSEKIRVRLCFSSLSLFQKLFHTQSVTGQTYPPSTWTKKLGLPDPRELGGLDLQIKSIFLLPFSVMHPKFIIIDREIAVLPSCNISWEAWFEGCITVGGPIVGHFMEFYHRFWSRQELPPLTGTEESINPGFSDADTLTVGHAHIIAHWPIPTGQPPGGNIQTVFLPSPHRRNPRLRFFVATEKVVAPPTPLNTFILTLFAKADKAIRIQSPNMTSPPVLSSLLKALERGIDVQILTSERLMILEQLVTAGNTTSRCVKKLIKRYEKLNSNDRQPMSDEEAAISATKPGRLQISYFKPLNGPQPKGKEKGEPQQSHLKMTIVDGDVLVLGSGNLDRASWFTSQELGVAFFDKDLVKRVEEVVDEAMKTRAKLVYDSGETE